MITQIITRNSTSQEWSTSNPVLLLGEQGYDTTNKKLKIGDGVTKWNELPYQQTDGSVDIVTDLDAEGLTNEQVPGALATKQKLDHLWTEVDNLSGKNIGKRTALTPLFENAGAVFNDSTGFYELNDLLDIDESEMMSIYSASNRWINFNVFTRIKERTILQRNDNNRYFYLTATNYNSWFSYCYNMVTLNVAALNLDVLDSGLQVNSLNGFCTNCYELTKVIGVLDLALCGTISNVFAGCRSLTSVNIKQLKTNIPLISSPLLSDDSVLYMITNAKLADITNPISITLYSTVYARAMANTDIQNALEATGGKVLIASA